MRFPYVVLLSLAFDVDRNTSRAITQRVINASSSILPTGCRWREY